MVNFYWSLSQKVELVTSNVNRLKSELSRTTTTTTTVTTPMTTLPPPPPPPPRLTGELDVTSRATQIALFKQFSLVRPPPAKVPLNLADASKKHYSQHAQDANIDQLLRERRNGFFIEAGAYDGESLSNTLFLEKERNWTGLLIEPNPRAYRELVTKDRKVFATPACIATSKQMSQVEFLAHGMLGGILSGRMHALQDERNPYVYVVNATCFPLDVMLEVCVCCVWYYHFMSLIRFFRSIGDWCISCRLFFARYRRSRIRSAQVNSVW